MTNRSVCIFTGNPANADDMKRMRADVDQKLGEFPECLLTWLQSAASKQLAGASGVSSVMSHHILTCVIEYKVVKSAAMKQALKGTQREKKK